MGLVCPRVGDLPLRPDASHHRVSFEVVAAILLAVGVFVRTISFLLFAHLIVIVAEIGLNPTGVRDLGLAAGFLSLMLSGPDALSLGKK